MFNRIAKRYDRMNRIISLGRDVQWRARTVGKVEVGQPERVLDLACGTCDLTLAMADRLPQIQLQGLDFSREMLAVGQYKVAHAGYSHRITLAQGAAEQLPFPNAHFDVVTCAFGVRNFADVPQAMRECHRVLKPGGKIIILEFAIPSAWYKRLLFNLYSYTLVPFMGFLFAGAYREYQYLPKSIAAFSKSRILYTALEAAGFDTPTETQMNLGSVRLVCARRS